jgi:hypothetical protein
LYTLNHLIKYGMTKAKKLTFEEAKRRVDEALSGRGARWREVTARQLLLHPDDAASATSEELEALQAYVKRKGWRSLYGHDRRMYRILRSRAKRLK